MFLLLFLLLQSSLVPHSLQDPHDNHDSTALSGDLKGGFPVGTLLTLYLKMLLPTKDLRIDLYDDADTFGGRLQFHLLPTQMVSNVANETEDRKGWKGRNYTGGEQTFNSSSPFNTSGTEDWWRFDLYKISETEFLPFFQGFHAHLRTMIGVKYSKSVFIWNFAEYGNIFDKDDAYMWHRLPTRHYKNNSTLWSKRVLAALDQESISNNKKNITEFMNGPTFFFYNEIRNWTFGFYNTWNDTSGMVQKDCNGDAPNRTTSTDLVHVKLERPTKTTIKMRVFWRGGSAAGIKCTIDVGDEGAAHLDNKLTIESTEGAALLYFSKNL